MHIRNVVVAIGAVASVVAGLVVVGPAPSASAAPPSSGRFTAVAPVRAWSGSVGTTTVQVPLAGRNGIPASATAVALTATVAKPTASGTLAVSSQTVQYVTAGRSVSVGTNAVLSSGRVGVRLSAGKGTVSLDLAGWYGSGGASSYTPVAPRSVLRATVTTTPRKVSVTGGGVPANATAVVLQADVSRPAGSGSARFTPAGKDVSVAAISFTAGATIANTTTVTLAGGAFQTRVSAGKAVVNADVVGYWAPGAAGSSYVPTPGVRAATAALTTTNRAVRLTGTAGVPRNATAVVANAKVNGASTSSSVQVSGSLGASTLPTQVSATGRTLANAVVLPVSASGTVNARVLAGKATLSLDVSGYFTNGVGGSGTGVDVSWPQGPACTAVPTDQSFGVVGVNGSLANTTNPCLAQQLAWAKGSAGGTAQPKAQVYSLFTNPGAAKASVWPSSNTLPGGPTVSVPTQYTNGECTAQSGAQSTWKTTTACSYVYGYTRAYEAANTRGVTDPGQYRWWLDVETGLSYVSDTAQNRAALEGMIAALRASGVTSIGLYSTTSQFATIMGTVQTTSPIRPLPSWIALGTARLDQAQAACTGKPLTAGKIAMTQYVTAYGSGKIDRDWSCS
ncbi:hypothetical protein [Curtobacterium sp. NPDC089689]|uniref:hypothetical protein n=1 Tax=Curtobacterium sp. NPDC089689 TaxID=3363968 RepID=UPI0038088AF7